MVNPFSKYWLKEGLGERGGLENANGWFLEHVV
jgi:hypothetical protein